MIIPFKELHLFKVKRWAWNGESTNASKDSTPFDPREDLEETVDLDAADIVTSQTYAGRHYVLFDVDIPMQVIESSTPGHSHVYIDTYVPWENLARLLDALADCRIVERGYAEASKARGFTALRLPWVRKLSVY